MFLAYVLSGFCALLLALASTYVLLQWRRKKKARQAIRRRHLVVSPMSGIALGAALLGFQAIVQPQVRHVIVEAQEDDWMNEKSDDELPGARLFHSQLRKIRTTETSVELSVRAHP